MLKQWRMEYVESYRNEDYKKKYSLSRQNADGTFRIKSHSYTIK